MALRGAVIAALLLLGLACTTPASKGPAQYRLKTAQEKYEVYTLTQFYHGDKDATRVRIMRYIYEKRIQRLEKEVECERNQRLR